MLKLYADLGNIDAKRMALIIAGQKFGVYPDNEDIQSKLNERMNIYDIRHNVLTEVIYLRELCECKNDPSLMRKLFDDAGWNEDLFEWLEIDPLTGIGIEPKTDEEILIHNLRATNGRYTFNNLRDHQKTQDIVNTYVFQSPGFRGSNNGDQADVRVIPKCYITDDILVYIAQTCDSSIIRKLPSDVFTDSLVKRLAVEAPAPILSLVPDETLTDAVLFLFYRHHDKINDLRNGPNIGTSRKADLLETALVQSHIDHKLLRNICRSIVNMDELPGSTECNLVKNSPYLLQLFFTNSTVFDTNSEGNFTSFAIQMAYDALHCKRMVPSPYDRDQRLYKGSDIARKLLPPALVEICDQTGGVSPLHGGFGVVRWHAADLVAAATKVGIDMTPEKAVNWWKTNETAFKNRMMELGNEVLEDMLSYQKGETS